MRPPQILVDQFSADAGSFLMFLRIILLDVEEQEIEERSQSVKDFRTYAAGGLDRGVYTFLFKTQDQRFHEARLHHAFTAGDGHAAAGLLIKIEVLHTHFYNLINCFIFPFICQRPSGTALYAGKTTCTFMEADMDPSVLGSSDCLRGTGVHTPLTVQAVVAVVHDLHSGELGLRIGAPFAAKGTSLQENRGPHAGTVVDGELLNIKDDSFHFHNLLWLLINLLKG